MHNWDEVVPIFLPKTDSVKTRVDVAGPASPKWIDKHLKVDISIPNPSEEHLKAKAVAASPPLDVFSFVSRPSGYGYLIGLRMNWDMFNDSTANYNTYRTGVYALLENLNNTKKNENVNATTFDRAADALQGVAKLLVTSLDKKSGLLGWIDQLGDTGDNWRGSAAGEFKKYLSNIALALTHIQTDLLHPDDFEAQLRAAGTSLRQSHQEMLEVEAKWFATPDSGATQVLKRALDHHLAIGPRIDEQYAVWADGLNIAHDPFWDKVEQTAKGYWLAGLSANVLTLSTRAGTLYSMDSLADSVYTYLDAEYTRLAGALGRGVIQPNLGLPQSPGGGAGGPVPGPGAGGEGGTGDGGEGGGGNEQGGSQDIPPPGGNLNLGGGSGGKGGKGGGDKNTVKPPGPTPGPLIPNPSTGLPGNGTANLLDKEGKPVLGKDHQPITVPVGSVIGKDGKIRDSKGNLVLGKDGKPLVAPPGAKLKEQPATNPGGGLDPLLLDRIKVPEGAKVNPDGVLVDAKGKPLLDSNGNPYVLPKGASVNADGILVDAKGRPIDRSSQLLADTEHALLDSRRDLRPVTSSQSLGSGGRDALGLSGGGHLSGLGASAGGGAGGKGSGSAGPLLAAPSMVSDRALQAADAAAPPGTEADRAKATAAEDAARQLATQQQTQSGPMMPPMGGAGMGAGAGAGGAGGQKDRQRTTWLSEDEDTWGTDTGTVSGVIGR
ncbi:hypothetical protein J7F03_16330 [Streptomyces sp. ISL-43]|uniref:hypothetical protein n=1 Tax=Streptomyces sp. ISL-43 TaxID=2819183 RepID=UPI001BEB3AE0|nr:hypothetical protein [Streptomyces sp. ISL-43]MBT2448629.1 hypothetical protein [Streptomyces sp. ISL-43]